jgi:hypothetical protein
MFKRHSRRRSQSETEEQLAYLRQQIAQAKAELVECEAELIDLRTESQAFRLKYDTQVGRKEEELRSIEKECKARRQKISFFRQWGPKGPPQANYVPVEEQYRRIWEQPPKPPSPPPAEPIDEATQAQIKTLYRQLVLRFHPDLAQSAEEKAWRTEVMTAINGAYTAQSLAELRGLSEQPNYSSTAEPATDEQRLVALRDQLQQIERRLVEVDDEIAALTNSPEVALSLDVKLAWREGRDLLAEMAAEVEEELSQKRAVLDDLKAEMDQLGLTL